MPDKQRPVWSRQKARAIDDVRAAVEDRLYEYAVLGRVVFEIRVLNDDDVSGGAGYSRAQRCAFALVDGMVEQSHRRDLPRRVHPPKHFPGSIA